MIVGGPLGSHPTASEASDLMGPLILANGGAVILLRPRMPTFPGRQLDPEFDPEKEVTRFRP